MPGIRQPAGNEEQPNEQNPTVFQDTIMKEQEQMPAILFDGYSVWEQIKKDRPEDYCGTEEVCMVLDAIVKIMKRDTALQHKEQT